MADAGYPPALLAPTAAAARRLDARASEHSMGGADRQLQHCCCCCCDPLKRCLGVRAVQAAAQAVDGGLESRSSVASSGRTATA